MKRSGRVISLLTSAMMLVSFNSAYVSADTDIIGTSEASEASSESVFKAELSGGGIMYYNDFGEALAAAQNGGTITLQADLSLKENYVISGNVTLDLNGHTWTVPEYDNDPLKIDAALVDSRLVGDSRFLDYDTYKYKVCNSLFYVINGGSLTVKDTVGTGSIVNRNDVMNTFTSFDGSLLEILGGKYLLAPKAYRNWSISSVQTYEGSVRAIGADFDVDMSGCSDSILGTYGDTRFKGLLLAVGRGNAYIEDCHASYLYIGDNSPDAEDYKIMSGDFDKIEFIVVSEDTEVFKTAFMLNLERNGAECYINNKMLEYSDLVCYQMYGTQCQMKLTGVSVKNNGYRGASGMCGPKAFWKIEKDSVLISGSGEMNNFDSSSNENAPWYEYKDKISNISISDTITLIGRNSFNGFANVESVTLPVGVRTGYGAFRNMNGLKYITVGCPAEYMESYSFIDCDSICHVHIPCGTTADSYSTRCVSPENKELYYPLDKDGYCTSYNCPLGMSRPHEHDFGSGYFTDSEYHWQQCECGEMTEKEAHSYGPEWKSDKEGHWHECKCGYKISSEKHISDNGVVTTKPTETTKGTMTYSCTECGYVIRTEDIPALNEQLSITYESGSVETAEGLSADLSIKATGEGLSYCWKKKVGNSFEDVGCTSDSLHIEKALESNTYICVVTDKNGKSVTSSEIKLTVIAAEDVSAGYVKTMSDEECISFVNYFSSAGKDSFILSDGMMSAVERVLAYDGII